MSSLSLGGNCWVGWKNGCFLPSLPVQSVLQELSTSVGEWGQQQGHSCHKDTTSGWYKHPQNSTCSSPHPELRGVSVFAESPTVMLSAGSFSSPYEHLSQPETKRMVEHYTAYLSDNTRLIANPGLKVSPGPS